MELNSNHISGVSSRREFLKIPLALSALLGLRSVAGSSEIGGPWFKLYEGQFARDKKTGEKVWCYRGNVYYLRPTGRPAPNSSEECDIYRIVPNLRGNTELGSMWEVI